MSFNRVTYWIMGEGLLTGVKMTQRQLHYQNPLMGNSSQKAGDIEHTALPKDRSKDWSVSLLSNSDWFQSSWDIFCFFQVPDMLTDSSSLLGLSESDSQQSLLFTLEGKNLVKLVSFRDFLKLFCDVYLMFLGTSLGDGMFQPLRKLLHNML